MAVADAKVQLDSVLTILSARCATYQPGYLTTNGRYWQGVQTPGIMASSCPNHDAPQAADMTRRPTDQSEDWNGPAPVIPQPVKGAFAIDTYGASSGQGYVIRVMVRDGTMFHVKQQATGPEAALRTYDWISPSVSV